jgi:hypothetical protein
MWVPSDVLRASRSPVSDDLLVEYRRTETEERGPGVFSPHRIFWWRRRMDVFVPPSLIAFYENRQCRTDSPSARQSSSIATGIRNVAAPRGQPARLAQRSPRYWQRCSRIQLEARKNLKRPTSRLPGRIPERERAGKRKWTRSTGGHKGPANCPAPAPRAAGPGGQPDHSVRPTHSSSRRGLSTCAGRTHTERRNGEETPPI